MVLSGSSLEIPPSFWIISSNATCPPGEDTSLHVQHDFLKLRKAVAFVPCQVSEVDKMC